MKTILVILGLTVFAVCFVGNLGSYISNRFTKNRKTSLIPIIGGICGAVAIWLSGVQPPILILIPLFIDVGCLPSIILYLLKIRK